MGSDVKVSGIKIGEVKSMKLDPNYFIVTLELSLDDGAQIPQDSSAQIESSSILGSKYIAITPGGSDLNLLPKDTLLLTPAMNIESIIRKYFYYSSSKSN